MRPVVLALVLLLAACGTAPRSVSSPYHGPSEADIGQAGGGGGGGGGGM